MAATPQYCAFYFIGASGKSYSIDGYVSDVNAAAINLDGGTGAGTGSPTFWIPPENVILKDFSMVTGTADTEKLRLTKDGRPTAHVVRYGVHLTSLATRPALTIGFPKGCQFGAFQISD